MRSIQLRVCPIDAPMVDAVLRELAPRAHVLRSSERGGALVLRIVGAAPVVTDYLTRALDDLAATRARLEALWPLEAEGAGVPAEER